MPYIENVTTTILYLQALPKWFQQFKKICIEYIIKPKKFKLEVQHRWNSTDDMLSSCTL